MLFAIGFLSGIVFVMAVVAVIAFFEKPVENMVERIHRDIKENAKSMNFRPTGSVYFPPDDADIARAEIVEANKEAGKDTKISELQ